LTRLSRSGDSGENCSIRPSGLSAASAPTALSPLHDGEDVRDDFWTAEVDGWWSRCPDCGDLHYLAAPETRAQVAAAVARGQLVVTLASFV
jgi:hypothetical protein